MNKRVFISHASEDKDIFVRQLAIHLKNHNIDIWYDEFEIKPGMSIRESIDKGLSLYDIGLIVLSPNYFSKKWTVWELNGVIQKMHSGRALIIPIWLNITHSELLDISPPLADILGISSNKKLTDIASEIYNLIYPNEPLLISAAKKIENEGFKPPDYHNDWWVDIIEFLGRDKLQLPWSLPKNPDNEDSQKKFYKIAWAGLRFNWIKKCMEMEFNQFTPPKDLINTINNTPGMREACNNNIEYLALYAPQLFFCDNEFTNKMHEVSMSYKERLLKVAVLESYQCSLTVNGQIPTCNRIFALAEEKFGCYLPLHLLMHFVEGESLGPRPSHLGYWGVLIYLCSSKADIYPTNIKDILIEGYYNKYVIGKLKSIFLNQCNGNVVDIFSDIKLVEQVVNEVVSDYSIEISDTNNFIAEKICKLNLFDKEYEDSFIRLTIPKDDVTLGFRGITTI